VSSVYLPNDSPIHEYIAQASEATAKDPRLAEVTRAWSDCMAEQGYDFDDRDEMCLPLQEDAEPLMAAYAGQGQALVDAGRAWDDMNAESGPACSALQPGFAVVQRRYSTRPMMTPAGPRT
jgi:hypothetical protein